jgi:excinuclease UvrABC ATPase subunit
LRLLYARAGIPRCPDHDVTLEAQTVSQMVDQVMALPEGTAIMLLAPVIQDRKGEHLHVFEQLKADGFVRARIDGIVVDLDEAPTLDKLKKHTIEVVVDRLKVRPDIALRLAESFETALRHASGIALVAFMDGDKPDQIFSARYACPHCGYSLPSSNRACFPLTIRPAPALLATASALNNISTRPTHYRQRPVPFRGRHSRLGQTQYLLFGLAGSARRALRV